MAGGRWVCMGPIRRYIAIAVTAGSVLLAPGLATVAYGALSSPAGPSGSVVREGGSSIQAALAVAPKGTRWSGTRWSGSPKGTRWSTTPTGTRWSSPGPSGIDTVASE